MKRRKLYLYNPETDNFERFYPSFKDRFRLLAISSLIALVLAVGIYLLIFYAFETPTVENLTAENAELKQQFNVLERRLNTSLNVMSDIQARDANFYRVMLQMEPASSSQVISERNLEERYRDLGKINDSRLAMGLFQRLDSLDKELLFQSYSFNQLVKVAKQDRSKLDHIPSVLPINIKDYTMSSGYGVRIDPVYNSHKFHAGLDFAAKIGTPVFATADGEVSFADMKGVYGNCVDINHGYDYMSRYAHLSKILVKQGQNVKRGELIGLVGTTGKSTGPHLHYEVRFKDDPQNPVNYYYMDLTPEQYDEMIEMAENAGHVMD